MWLNHINPPFVITDDGIRDQLLARDCTDLGRCHTVGANASLKGFHHGPVWLDLLVGVRLLGGDTATERTLVVALMALSVATLFVVVWRWLRPWIAAPASVFFVAALSADSYPSLLINPSLAALPDVVAAAGILGYGLCGRRRFLIVAAFALGVATSVHIGALGLLVPLVATAGLMRDRSWREMLAAAAIVVATYGITSTAALRANALALAQPGRLLPACAAFLVLAALCTRLGPRFRQLAWDTRAWIMGLMLIVPFGLALIWLVVREHHHVSVMYLHPVLGPTAVLAAALLTLPFELIGRRYAPLRWVPAAGSLAMAAIVVLFNLIGWPTLGARESLAWTAAEAGTIAGYVVESGWEYEDVLFRLQSSGCRELLTGMSIAAPAPSASAEKPRHLGRQLQVVKMRFDELPRLSTTHAVLALDRGTVAIVREIDSWLQPEMLRACRAAGGKSAPRCAPAHRKVIDAIGPERFLFITRAFPEIHSLDVARPYTATYEIPLVANEAGTRDVAMIDLTTPDCGWRITRADGVHVENPLPARRARLRAESGARGMLVVERTFGATPCGADDADMRYPPCIFETAADDPLMALVSAP